MARSAKAIGACWKRRVLPAWGFLSHPLHSAFPSFGSEQERHRSPSNKAARFYLSSFERGLRDQQGLLDLVQQRLEQDPFELPKRLGICQEFCSPRPLTTGDIIERIVRNRQRYEERNAKKGKAEAAYHRDKSYVSEI